MSGSITLGIAFWIFVVCVIVVCIRRYNKLTIDDLLTIRRLKALEVAIIAMTILVLIIPMRLSPTWNGNDPGHRKQYEDMADAIISGHLYLDYEVDPLLNSMANPYDKHARIDMGVEYRHDSAFYKGKYYMYFGIVPTLFLCVPYKLLTGNDLTTYHVTQIFALLLIIGIFALFKDACKRWFRELPIGVYLVVSVAFSFLITWYAVGAPALYCTAIISGICMEIWSIYFFFKAAFDIESENRALLYAVFGSLLGALCVECRMPIALANIVIVPLLFVYIRKNGFSVSKIWKLVIALLPYIVIGILVMVYNYARFENPFEFGQSYQLTVADQSNYGNIFERWNWAGVINGVKDSLFVFKDIEETFPYVSFSGLFVEFPLLLISFAGILYTSVKKEIKKDGLGLVLWALIISTLIIIINQILWTPYLLERYKMDYSWIIAVMSFLIIGYCYRTCERKALFSNIVVLMGMITIITSFMFFCIPYEGNFTEHYPEWLEKFRLIITLGLGK